MKAHQKLPSLWILPPSARNQCLEFVLPRIIILRDMLSRGVDSITDLSGFPIPTV